MRVLLYEGDRTKDFTLKHQLERYGCIVDFEAAIDDLSRQDAADLMCMRPYTAVLVPGDLGNVFRQASFDFDTDSHAPILNNNISLSQAFSAVTIAYGHGFQGHVIDVSFGEDTLSIDLMNHKNCMKNGEFLDLIPKEHSLLRMLALKAGSFVSKDILKDNIWSEPADMNERNLDVQLSILRKKIGFDFIESRRDLGVKLASDKNMIGLIPKLGLHISDDNRVYVHGEEVKIEPQLLKILTYLNDNASAIRSRDDILAHLFPNEATRRQKTENLIRVQIFRLNKALASASKSDQYPNGLKFIESVIGQGYRMLPVPTPIPAPIEPKTAPFASSCALKMD